MFQAPPGGGRLDRVLVGRFAEYSRNRLQALIRAGNVKVNGVLATKSGFQLEGGERVEISFPAAPPAGLQAECIPLDIIFENDDLIVVNKPAGMVVHPAPGHSAGTLVNAIMAYAPDLRGVGGEGRPGVVHRLDKDTSGLVLIAKDNSARDALQSQFKDRAVEKVYIALVDGKPPTPKGRIEAPIGRDDRRRKRMAVQAGRRGRSAVTQYSTLEGFRDHTLLEVQPLTGRTHQIRVHLAYLGSPVAGDRTYGLRNPTIGLNRHFLHAARLTLRIPGREGPQTFEAQLPDELQAVLRHLRTYRNGVNGR